MAIRSAMTEMIDRLFTEVIGAQMGTPTECQLVLDGVHSIDGVAILEVAELGGLNAKFYYEPKGFRSHESYARSVRAFSGEGKAVLRVREHTELDLALNQVGGRAWNIGQGTMPAYIAGNVTNQWFGHKEAPIVGVTFTLADFPRFSGPESSYVVEVQYSDRSYPQSATVLGVVLLEAENWEISLRECVAQEEWDTTHIGNIRRKNGDDFSLSDLEDILGSLNMFFTFVAGSVRGPGAVIGIFEDSVASFGALNSLKVHPKSASNWFDGSMGDTLRPLFGQFCKVHRGGSKLRRQRLEDVVIRYAESERIAAFGLYRGALIVSYSALEAMTQWYLNLEEIDPPAIDRVIKALETASISISPEEEGELREIIRNRNNVAHANLEQGAEDRNYLNWNRCQMWVERLIFAKLRYGGAFRNRTVRISDLIKVNLPDEEKESTEVA